MSANYFVIETIVNDWISQKKSFTAHDVTVEMRQRGHKIKHDEVKIEVHSLYDRGLMGKSYKKTSVELWDRQATNPSIVRPFLYHEVSVDPQSYGNVQKSVSVSTQPQTNSLPNPIGNADPSLVDASIIQIPDFDD